MKHARPAGIAVISALAEMGRALGYEVREEHKVGTAAAVDLSWIASASDRAPLFIFEVESTASVGLAGNATKVFGSPLDELAKPLFFFHVVLAGRADNERIRNNERAWGTHNYRVYRFSDPIQQGRLVGDVLDQHRRIRDHASPLAVARALTNPVWPTGTFAVEALSQVERHGFCASYLHDYAVLASRDRKFLGLFVQRLRWIDEHGWPDSDMPFTEGSHRNCEGYGEGPGNWMPSPLEVAIRIFAGDIADEAGPDALEAWARGAGGTRAIDPTALGWKQDYDNFVVCIAPVHYAWAATLLAAHPQSRDWLLRDLASVLDGERDRGLMAPLRWSAVVWLAHLLSASNATEGDSVGSPRASELDVKRLYEGIRRHAEEAGGVPATLILDPPKPHAVMFSDEPRWFDEADLVPLPGRDELRMIVLQDLGTGESAGAASVGDARDMLGVCLEALVSHTSYDMSTRAFLRTMHSV